MPPALTIRILGAGVSGLSSAILLASDGHRVELTDERFTVPSIGTALALFGAAQRVLVRLGVLEEVRALAAAPEAGTLRASDGWVLATVPAGDALLISRSALVRILFEALPDSVRRIHRRVEDVRPLRDGADLLIGADGVHSLVRRSGWPDHPGARAHGMAVLRGTAELAPPEISETWGRGWLVGITPLAANSTNWFACLPEHRTASRKQDLAHLRQMVGGHRAVIDEVLAAATAERTLVHGIHTVPPVWPIRQNAVLLGDAAHAMAPNLGHGANTSLQDAESLALAVRDAAIIRPALRRHASRRALLGQGWRLASAAMLCLAMTSGAAPLRDRVLSGSIGRLGVGSLDSGTG